MHSSPGQKINCRDAMFWLGSQSASMYWNLQYLTLGESPGDPESRPKKGILRKTRPRLFRSIYGFLIYSLMPSYALSWHLRGTQAVMWGTHIFTNTRPRKGSQTKSVSPTHSRYRHRGAGAFLLHFIILKDLTNTSLFHPDSYLLSGPRIVGLILQIRKDHQTNKQDFHLPKQGPSDYTTVPNTVYFSQ